MVTYILGAYGITFITAGPAFTCFILISFSSPCARHACQFLIWVSLQQPSTSGPSVDAFFWLSIVSRTELESSTSTSWVDMEELQVHVDRAHKMSTRVHKLYRHILYLYIHNWIETIYVYVQSFVHALGHLRINVLVWSCLRESSWPLWAGWRQITSCFWWNWWWFLKSWI